MRKATTLLLMAMLVSTGSAFGQSTDFSWAFEVSADTTNPFPFNHSGVRTVDGPFDLDDDGNQEVIVSDYSYGGRAYVLENTGPDSWEFVWASPPMFNDSSTNNMRTFGAGDLDGDGNGEIFWLSGRGSTQPEFPEGLYVYEYTGTDDDYGDAPATIYEFPDNPDRWRAEQMTVMDIDGDGDQELMFGNNGAANAYDNWYILSVDGDIGSGFETWNEEARFSSRDTEDFDPVNRGGGSGYGIVGADLDGDGINEVVLGAWNSLNISMVQATSADTYTWEADGDQWAHLAPQDNVSLFGLDVIDIDGDGNDEVFGSEYDDNPNDGNIGGDVYIVNYDSGEDVFSITDDNFVYDVIPGLSALGLTAGDLDGDGHMELIGTGSSYTSNQFEQGLSPNWVNIVEYNSGDPEDPASYSDIVEVRFPNDMTDAFDIVNYDSLGTTWTQREPGEQGPQFASKMKFIGDPDGDGQNEVVVGFQGMNDSLRTFSMVWNETDEVFERTQTGIEASGERVFMRVLSANGENVSFEREHVIIPTDYKLDQNYPNPFNPSTNISFTLPRDRAISVTVYDATGRVVKTLVDNQFYTEGTHQVTWDGTTSAGNEAASGTYLYRLQFGNFSQSKTMVLLR